MGKPIGKVVSVLAAGPLGPFADVFRERLTKRGYAPVTTAKHVIHLGHLSRWLEVHGMGPADLTRERLGQFVAARQALVGHRGCSLQGLLPVLEILEERGVVSAPCPPQPASAAEVIAGSFGCYLAAERGDIVDGRRGLDNLHARWGDDDEPVSSAGLADQDASSVSVSRPRLHLPRRPVCSRHVALSTAAPATRRRRAPAPGHAGEGHLDDPVCQ